MNIRKPNILVIGDTILDKYIYLESKKMSDEAPVITYEQSQIKYVLGGGANVVKNLKSLNANCYYLGLCSKETKQILEKLFKEKKIKNKLILVNKAVPIKTRLISKNQQIFRFDSYNEICLENHKTIIDQINIFLKNEINKFDAIIFSKYFDGFMTPKLVNQITSLVNVPTYLDNRQANNHLFQKIYTLKLNWNEFNNMLEKRLLDNVDEQIVFNSLTNLYKNLSYEKIIVTRANKSVIAIDNYEIKTYKVPDVKVVDVSGAGDTFIATLALMHWQHDFEYALKIAINASSLVVEKLGTSSIYKYELKNVLEKDLKNNFNDLIFYIKKQKNEGKKIVFTNGVFDIFHVGHLDLLKQAKEKGDVLIVAINSDKTVKKLKGKNRPINNEIERKNILEAISYVDFVYIFDEMNVSKIIKRICPDVYVKGGDYNMDNLPEKNAITKIKEILFVSKTFNKSTTSTIQLIQEKMIK